jgi:hypothetical protein
MTEYDNTNRGGLWKNKKKDPANPDYKETLPDFTGDLDVDGVKFFVDAWKRKPDANPNAPDLSFKVKRKEVQVHRERTEHSITERATAAIRRPDPITSGRMPPKQSIMPDDDTDIPF